MQFIKWRILSSGVTKALITEVCTGCPGAPFYDGPYIGLVISLEKIKKKKTLVW